MRCTDPNWPPNRPVGNGRSIVPLKFFILGFLFLILVEFSFGAVITSKDTVRPVPKEYKLREEQFYSSYGRDDSSRALINYYFYERNNAKRMTLGGAITLVLSLLITGLLIVNNPSPPPGTLDNYTEGGIIVFFGLTFYGSLALIITGTIRWAIFSRKKLFRLLKNYYSANRFRLISAEV